MQARGCRRGKFSGRDSQWGVSVNCGPNNRQPKQYLVTALDRALADYTRLLLRRPEQYGAARAVFGNTATSEILA